MTTIKNRIIPDAKHLEFCVLVNFEVILEEHFPLLSGTRPALRGHKLSREEVHPPFYIEFVHNHPKKGSVRSLEGFLAPSAASEALAREQPRKEVFKRKVLT